MASALLWDVSTVALRPVPIKVFAQRSKRLPLVSYDPGVGPNAISDGHAVGGRPMSAGLANHQGVSSSSASSGADACIGAVVDS